MNQEFVQYLSRFSTDATISQGGVLDPGQLGQKNCSDTNYSDMFLFLLNPLSQTS